LKSSAGVAMVRIRDLKKRSFWILIFAVLTSLNLFLMYRSLPSRQNAELALSTISVWDWRDIDVPPDTIIKPNTKYEEAQGLNIFLKSNVEGWVEAVTFVSSDPGHPMLWIYIDGWDVRAMSYWGIKYESGMPFFQTAENLNGLYKVSYTPKVPIYFRHSIGLKLSNSLNETNRCTFVWISIRFHNPKILGRPFNEITSFNDIEKDHMEES